ncbi:MAG TPA: anti-sigma factor [Gaiellaceae bacterium]|nr:anti-sigma factor [Gaiellaceae bacterium]
MEAGIHQLTAGYALDALDAEERREYEAHLPTCAHCQEELASFWETTEALAVAASGPEPSFELRERILAEVRAEPPQVVVPFESRRRRAVPVLAAAAAIAAVVALGVGVWATNLSSELDDTRAALDRERAATSVLVDPDARAVPLQAGEGRLVVNQDGEAVLVLHGVDPAPAGKTYELWIVPGGDIASANRAGLFSGREGSELERLEGTVRDGDVVAVTIEEAGGVDAPTTTPIIASEPV